MIRSFTYVLATLILALSCLSAPAQSIPAAGSSLSTTPDSIPQTFGRWYLPRYQSTPAVADTAGALVALFMRKRRNTWWYLPFSALGLALIQPGEATTNGIRTGSVPPESWQYAVGIPLLVGGITPLIGRRSVYSHQRLRKIQQNYEQGNPIPASLRRRLKPRYFTKAIFIRAVAERRLRMENLRARQEAVRN